MKLLILGSGPNAPQASAWERAPFDRIIAVNNAWRIRSDWDDLIYPHDFPASRMPKTLRARQRFIDETAFVPAQNAFGGFVYGGATMAFTAGYWAIHALGPSLIAYFGCDMVYPASGATHFYGKGTADPLRADVSLRSLEAKSARLQCYAAAQECSMVNLSHDESRLIFPRASLQELAEATPAPSLVDPGAMARAERLEAAYGYRTPTGFHDHLTPDVTALDRIDALWLEATRPRLAA